MPRPTPQQLAAIKRKGSNPTPYVAIEACQLANIPIDLVSIKTAVTITRLTRAFFSRRIHAGDFKAYRVGKSRIMVSLSQIVSAVEAKPWRSPDRQWSPTASPASGTRAGT